MEGNDRAMKIFINLSLVLLVLVWSFDFGYAISIYKGSPSNVVLTDEQKQLLEAFKESGTNTTYKVFIRTGSGDLVGSGTGFILQYKSRLFFITNSHVCFPSGYINTIEIGGEPRMVTKRKRSTKADLCAARVSHLLSLPYLTLSPFVPLVDEDLYTVGYPKGEYDGVGLKFVETKNTTWVTGFMVDRKDPSECNPDEDLVGTPLQGMCLTDTPMSFNKGRIYPGASGSPVLNSDGDVVGVIAGTYGPYSLFVPAEKIVEFLEESFK